MRRHSFGRIALFAVAVVALATAGIGAAVALPAAQVSAEHRVAQPVTGPAFGAHARARAAFDGTNYLAVWDDNRDGVGEVWGARIAPDGTLLDKAGIAISPLGVATDFPSVAWDGAHFLVVWQQAGNGGNDIVAARVDAAGHVLDTTPSIIANSSADETFPSVAATGTTFLVTWTTFGGEPPKYNIGGTLVNDNGHLGTAPFLVSAAKGTQVAARAVGMKSSFFVAWTDDRSDAKGDVYGTRVSITGNVIDKTGIAISATHGVRESFSDLAWNGTDVLAIWQDFRSDANGDVYGARIAPDGTVLDPTGFGIATTAPLEQVPAAATALGGRFFVAWSQPGSGNSYAGFATRVGPNGTVVDPNGIALPIVSQALATSPQSVLALGAPFASPLLFGARLQGNTVLDPTGFLVTRSGSEQQRPAIAFDGTNHLVVWSDYRAGTFHIFGARVSTTGQMLDGAGFKIGQGIGQVHPRVAFAPIVNEYLVVWSDGNGIRGSRITTDGTVLDRTGLSIAGTGEQPDVTFDGTHFVVVWTKVISSVPPQSAQIRAKRVGTNGTVVDSTPITVSDTPGVNAAPAIASNGNESLVVWQDAENAPPPDPFLGPNDIRGARLDTSAHVIGSRFDVSNADGEQTEPAVAGRPDGAFQVVWTDARTGVGDDRIVGARVSAAGAVLDSTGVALTTSSGTQDQPAIAFDGTKFLVTFTDNLLHVDGDIFGVHVNSGAPLEQEFPIAATATREQYPAVTASGNGFATAYTRFVLPPAYGADRAFVRFVGD